MLADAPTGKELEMYSKALAHVFFRNGEVENLHSSIPELGDDVMKVINKDVHSRIYSFLAMWFYGDDKDRDILKGTLETVATYYGNNWDPPKLMKFVELF